MNEQAEKIVEYIADKLEKMDKQMELQSKTLNKIIEDIQDLQSRSYNLHKRLSKFEK